MSLEIFDGEVSAAGWAEAHGDSLTEAALSGGARNWSWHTHGWGVIFEAGVAARPSLSPDARAHSPAPEPRRSPCLLIPSTSTCAA
jgi:hypothetical protein